MTDTDLRVHDVPDDNHYEVRDGERRVGLAAYQRDSQRMVFTHTEVEPELEGHGVGGTLVRFALDDARTRGLTVVPQCPFVARFIDGHSEYADLVR